MYSFLSDVAHLLHSGLDGVVQLSAGTNTITSFKQQKCAELRFLYQPLDAAVITLRVRCGVFIKNSLEVGLFLGEDSDTEVSVLVGFEGGRNNQILSGRQTEAAADFSQVDEGFGASGGGMTQEEVPVQVDAPLTGILKETRAGNFRSD